MRTVRSWFESNPSNAHGFCWNLDHYENGPMNIWAINGMAFFVSFMFLMSWAHYQNTLRTNGYFTSAKLIIFPVHLNILILLAFTALFQAVGLMALSVIDSTEDDDSNTKIGILYAFAIIQSISFGIAHAVTDGTMWLLWSNGIGKRSLRISTVVGLISGSIVGFCVFAVSVQDLPGAVFKDKEMNQFCNYFWQVTNLVYYLVVWLMPSCGSLARVTRRPALIYWARFWSMFRILIIVSNALIDYNIDFGYCMNMVAVLIFFIILKCWVCYRVFVLEANWWHGVAGSGTVIPCFWCASTSHNNGFLGNLLSGQERPSNSSFSNDQSNNSGEESSTIVAPFYDIELSEQSATALSNAMDQMGRFRGVSLERTEPGELTTEKDRQAFRFPGSTGLTSSLKRVRLKKKVPLIDFSCLKIVLKRLLGVGSTARVYEGKWCGRKVAVKVLFTVEITPEEIQRTCSEASLLHSLQSPFVVRLHGIAVLPPSLCAVLEMCSEGSLGDVLYQKELKNEVSNSWSMLGRFSNSVRETVVDRRTFTGRDSLKDGNRASGVHINGSSNQYVYALPWGERLELAVGAAQGLTVLVTAFPGTSHNDIKSANYLVDCPNKDAFSTRSEIVGTYTNDALFGEPLNNDPTSKMKFVVKLADVEFASTGATPEHMIRGDTPNWTAPEVLAGTSDVSPASDIYALANVLFEIATREAPFEKTKYHNDGDTSISIKQGIIEGCRPLFPKSQAAAQSELACAQGNEAEVNRLAIELSSRASFEKLVERSWSQDPASRPEAAVLLADLKGLHVDYYERIKAWSDNRRREGALIYKASSSENGRHEDDRLKAHSRLDFGVILKKKSSSIEV